MGMKDATMYKASGGGSPPRARAVVAPAQRDYGSKDRHLSMSDLEELMATAGSGKGGSLLAPPPRPPTQASPATVHLKPSVARVQSELSFAVAKPASASRVGIKMKAPASSSTPPPPRRKKTAAPASATDLGFVEPSTPHRLSAQSSLCAGTAVASPIGRLSVGLIAVAPKRRVSTPAVRTMRMAAQAHKAASGSSETKAEENDAPLPPEASPGGLRANFNCSR